MKEKYTYKLNDLIVFFKYQSLINFQDIFKVLDIIESTDIPDGKITKNYVLGVLRRAQLYEEGYEYAPKTQEDEEVEEVEEKISEEFDFSNMPLNVIDLRLMNITIRVLVPLN